MKKSISEFEQFKVQGTSSLSGGADQNGVCATGCIYAYVFQVSMSYDEAQCELHGCWDDCDAMYPIC